MSATVRAESLAHADRIVRQIAGRAVVSTFGIATARPDILVHADVRPGALVMVAGMTSAVAIEQAYSEALVFDAMRDSIAARRAGLRARAKCLETRAEGLTELAGLVPADVWFDAAGWTVTTAEQVSK